MTNRSNNLFKDTMSGVIPLLIYIGVNMLASFLVVMGWMFYHGIGTDLDQLRQNLELLTNGDYALFNYGTMVVSYIIGIPLFAAMFRRDEKERILAKNMNSVCFGKHEWLSGRFQFPPQAYLILLLGGIATCIAGSNLVELSGLNSHAESYALIENLFQNEAIWLQLVISGIGAPVLEELLFRGLIFKRFNRSSGLLASMFWSSMVFACFHANLVQGVYAFVIGFMLCFVYYRFRSLIAAVALHMVINLSAIFLTATGLIDFIYNSYVAFYGMTILCMVIIVGCLYGIELWVRPVTEA